MIEVKYNIDFKRVLKELEREKLQDTLNEGVADKFAKNSTKFIKAGKVEPELSENNPRGEDAPPLFDTGALANSLKGSSEGVRANSYAAQHRDFLKTKNKVKIAYEWNKDGKTLDVPQREYLVHYKKYNENDKNLVALRGTKGDLVKMYEDFQKKFVRLLNKRIRKK